MAIFKSDLQTNIAATPQSKNKVNKQGGRIRYIESTYTSPATGMPQIADVIEWCVLPVGAKIISTMSQINFSAGTASCTINIGDAVTPTRYWPATSVTSAAATLLVNPTGGGASFETTDNSGTATDNCKIQSVVAGAQIAANQVLTLRLAYVQD